jgi:hypothetical protein
VSTTAAASGPQLCSSTISPSGAASSPQATTTGWPEVSTTPMPSSSAMAGVFASAASEVVKARLPKEIEISPEAALCTLIAKAAGETGAFVRHI